MWCTNAVETYSNMLKSSLFIRTNETKATDMSSEWRSWFNRISSLSVRLSVIITKYDFQRVSIRKWNSLIRILHNISKWFERIRPPNAIDKSKMLFLRVERFVIVSALMWCFFFFSFNYFITSVCNFVNISFDDSIFKKHFSLEIDWLLTQRITIRKDVNFGLLYFSGAIIMHTKLWVFFLFAHTIDSRSVEIFGIE